jgi:hypothetical protein
MESVAKADKKTNHLQLWNRLFHTPPAVVSPISGGRLKAAKLKSSSPYYAIYRATETWGPAGVGWFTEQLELKIGNQYTYCHLALYYQHPGGLEIAGRPGTWGRVEQWGGALVSQEGPKSAYTNALGKCLSYLGLAGDLHSGQHDDPAYVAWAQASLNPDGSVRGEQQDPQQQQQFPAPPQGQVDIQALGVALASYEREHEVPREQAQAQANGWVGRQVLSPAGIDPSITLPEAQALLSGLRAECARRIAAVQGGAPGSAPAPTGAYPAQAWGAPGSVVPPPPPPPPRREQPALPYAPTFPPPPGECPF